jgi:transcriptional antiterminator RfaH
MSSVAGEHVPHWYAIHTHPKQEYRAENNLLAWNVKTFVPRYKSVRRNQYKSAPCYSVRPLFTGYIFAQFVSRPDVLHKIRYTRGVHSIVNMGKEPVPVDDAIVEVIMARQDEDGCVKLEDDIRPGDEVIVCGGAFSGFDGIFDRRIKDTERVVILLNTLYRFHVIVPDTDIKKRPAAAERFATSHHG